MNPPLRVEVLRGNDVESWHDVDVVAVGGDGRWLWSRGDGDRPVLPRSALKPIQAVPLVTSGAADRFASTDERLALACASHGGEPRHVEAVAAWLIDLGFDRASLECGAHAPSHRPSADALAASGDAPTELHNTCSGKHVGFLSICSHLEIEPSGYLDPGHPLQAEYLTPAIEELCGVSLEGATPGIDGCGMPIWSMSLDRLALGWAALDESVEGRRILRSMAAEPFMVAGSGRCCTRLMTDNTGIVVKTGAEGVYCGLALESGVAIALKARDGSTRASEAAIEWALAEFGAVSPQPPTILRNWTGTEVGSVRVAP